MPKFQVRVGFELPFWLAIAEGEYEVEWLGGKQAISLSNAVNRVDIGDFYLGSGAKGVIWCHEANGESTRRDLQKQHPTMPITRHQLKSVVTHTRTVDADDQRALEQRYESQKQTWFDESFAVVNRFIDAYSVVAVDERTRSEVGQVALWDIAYVVVSFWDGDGTRQIWGQMESGKPQTPRPEPFDSDRQTAFETLLQSSEQYPLPRLLSATASSQIQRGNLRAAIIDDWGAIELAIDDFVRELAQTGGLPSTELERLLKRLRLDEICRDLLPIVGGPKLTEWDNWESIRNAQDIRNRVVHAGTRATLGEAEAVHDAAIATLTFLAGWNGQR